MYGLQKTTIDLSSQSPRLDKKSLRGIAPNPAIEINAIKENNDNN